MDISALGRQSNALRAYASQGQEAQRPGQPGETRRAEPDAPAPGGDRVTLSPEARLRAVQQAGQADPADELRRSVDPRAVTDAQKDRSGEPPAMSPRSIAQALAAYSGNPLT